MATLKDHQQAMVDLLASGSGIPASSSRLAHAMHDVLSAMLGDKKESFAEEMTRLCAERIEATTPGLNDKALAGDIEACRRKATPAERRVKELENTVKQLRASNAKLRNKEIDVLGEVHKWAIDRCLAGRTNYTSVQNLIIDAYIGLEPEQAGCRKPDTQVDCSQCQHDYVYHETISASRCLHCGDVQK
ncbi:hypothetical protein AABH88_001012 [Salmonella enterica subsp. enterica serovar Typhimurium]